MEEDKIHFFYEDVDYKLQKEREIVNWLIESANKENNTIELVNCIFCKDDYLLEMNKQYLNHDYYTDIITFQYSEANEQLVGDLFISIERAKENSSLMKSDFNAEIHRLLIHGLLHLMGYKDKAADEKEVMTAKEDCYLSLLYI